MGLQCAMHITEDEEEIVYEKKKAIAEKIANLNPKYYMNVVEILKKDVPEKCYAVDIELDINSLHTNTLLELEKFCDSVESLSKYPHR